MNAIFDVIIIGAGAAGLFCAGEIKNQGAKILILEGNKKPGLKIQVSGGGRCNFTNKKVGSQDFYSQNIHFSKSALAQYTEEDFIELVAKENIKFYEKKLGQLFCKSSSKEIINLLLSRCHKNNVKLLNNEIVQSCEKNELFTVKTQKGTYQSSHLVIASGGLSFPGLGATNIGYKIAKGFNLKVTPLIPALVPLTLKNTASISGVSLRVRIKIGKRVIEDDLLFTHKGLSGPAILKASLYWNEGDPLLVNFFPDLDLQQLFEQMKQMEAKKSVRKKLKDMFPLSFIEYFLAEFNLDKVFGEISNKDILAISQKLNHAELKPDHYEGFHKAEVTRGGVATNEVSSKTMESHKVPNLYLVGEVLDVTGSLGGYNFQWAWSSAFVAARSIEGKL